MKQKALLFGLLIAVITPAATAAPTGFRESPQLTKRVAKISGVPEARVYCATSQDLWVDTVIGMGARAGARGYARIEQAEAYLAPWICVALERWLRGKVVAMDNLARGLDTLVHEAMHVRGWRDECVTERNARRELPMWMRELFGIRKADRQKALMKLVRADPLC